MGPVVCPPKLLSRPENIERESVSSLDTSGSQGDKDTLLPIGRSRTMASSEDRKQRKVASNSRYSVRRPAIHSVRRVLGEPQCVCVCGIDCTL